VHELVAQGPGEAKRAVVFDEEGFNRPLVAADYLSSRAVHVTFVTPLHTVGPKVEGMMLDEMAHQLADRGVHFLPGHDLIGWDGASRIRLRHILTGEEQALPAIDLVVALSGSASVSALAEELQGQVSELHVIGDAHLPQTVEEATLMGARLGRIL
jgi:hypothetical protein